MRGVGGRKSQILSKPSSSTVKWGNGTHPHRVGVRMKLSEVMCVGHPARRSCLTIVFADSEFVQTLIHKMQTPRDGAGVI